MDSRMKDLRDVQQQIGQVLDKVEVQQALVTALDKLPMFMEQMVSFERSLGFVSSVLSDKESMKYVIEGLQDDSPMVNLNHETLGAGIALLNKLPKLLQYLEVLEPWVEFAIGVLQDEDSMRYLTTEVGALTQPIQSTVDKGRSLLQDAKRKAAKDNSQMGVFTLVKLLRDPTLQEGLKLAKAVLEVIEERKQVLA